MRPSKYFSDNVGQLARYCSKYQLLSRSAFLLASIFTLGLGTANVYAQVTPDSTMSKPTTSPLVGNTYMIEGGTTSGSNNELLFHSFDSFSIDAEQTAHFMHSDSISTIFSRVTGNTPSQIDGIIRASAVIKASDADFFFLNPNGITFGPNARTFVGGSMVVSTADSFIFGDDFEFSSVDPQAVPSLLTVRQPIGLSLGQSAKGITINGRIILPRPNETFLAVGNGIAIKDLSVEEPRNIPSSGIFIESGQVELASIASDSQVNIKLAEDTLSPLGIDDSSLSDSTLGDIRLNDSFVLTNLSPGGSGGRITLRGGKIDIERSFLTSANRSDGLLPGQISIFASEGLRVNNSEIGTGTFSSGNGGNILIEAGGTLELLGLSRLVSQSESRATGAGGDIEIRTGSLSVLEGSNISTSALGDGAAGTLVLDIPDGFVNVSGYGIDSFGQNRRSGLFATGKERPSGRIQINSQDLLVENGGQIFAGTNGSGDSQGIIINTTESVQVRGAQSSITTSSFTINTGDAGPLRISTDRLEITDGGQVFTTTNGAGNGGDLTVNAGEVVLSGSGTSSGGSTSEDSGLFARTSGKGNSGRLSLEVGSLVIEDGATLTVSSIGVESEPTENFGEVLEASINADQVELDNGSIVADSFSGKGGSLRFEIQDFLLLRNSSFISATASTDANSGSGGNISIMAPSGLIIAVPGEDSDIFANASEGRGGNIDITALSILGLEVGNLDPENTRGNGTNDIVASSEFGTDGEILINNLELDPTEGTVELPAQTISLGQVAQRCFADSEGNNAFVVTGQGGATPSPRDIIRNENLASGGVNNELEHSDHATAIVEADGWHRDTDGTVVFVAQAPLSTATNGTHFHSCIDQNVAQDLTERSE